MLLLHCAHACAGSAAVHQPIEGFQLSELTGCAWFGAQTMVEDKETGNTLAAVNCYFMAQDGGMFKAQVPFAPYFYLQAKVRFTLHPLPT